MAMVLMSLFYGVHFVGTIDSAVGMVASLKKSHTMGISLRETLIGKASAKNQ
jgi:hypothetical protein